MRFDSDRLGLWGWDPNRELVSGVPGLVPARVVGREGPVHLVETPESPATASVTGRYQFTASEEDLPLVGDWALVQLVDAGQAVIHGVLPRTTVFRRGVSGGSKDSPNRPAPLAANLDVLAIVTGLDGNFNPRRAQRLATLARAGGIEPWWILTKADLPEAPAKIVQARLAAGDDPVMALSGVTGQGVEQFEARLRPGLTVALTGSSGVGKTTLVNRLRGSSLATTEVRADAKGRHTTTSRHLYRLDGGALLMDTPGFRSVGLWADGDDLAEGFGDIEALAASCRFHDCRHQDEPGCAVRAALEAGELEPSRWDGWRRQERELAHLARRDDKALQRAEKDRWRAIHQTMRTFSKERRAGG